MKLSAVMRSGGQWTDVRIVNISSRGMLIRAAHPASQGSLIQLRRGDHLISAEVVWRQGEHAGLRSGERLPVEEILSLGQAGTLRLVAIQGPGAAPARMPVKVRLEARIEARAMEFAGLCVVALAMALVAWAMMQDAMIVPLAKVTEALGGS